MRYINVSVPVWQPEKCLLSDICWLVTCEHGGNEVPAAYAPLFAGKRDLLASHRGWDPGSLEIAKELATRLQAQFYFTTISRLLVDCNRSAENPAVFSAITRVLSPKERLEIVEGYHRPYRQKIAQAIKVLRTEGRVIHLAVHSFTPELHGIQRNADMGLLYDSSREAEKAFCIKWQRQMIRKAPGLRIRRNYPYLGRTDGLATWLRRQYGDSSYIGIEVEINQQLSADATRHHSLVALLTETVQLQSAGTA